MPTQRLQTTTTAVGEQMRLTFYLPAEANPASHCTRVRELPESERPVQRLTWYGAGALSLAELLTVVAGFSDLETAQRLLPGAVWCSHRSVYRGWAWTSLAEALT